MFIGHMWNHAGCTIFHNKIEWLDANTKVHYVISQITEWTCCSSSHTCALNTVPQRGTHFDCNWFNCSVLHLNFSWDFETHPDLWPSQPDCSPGFRWPAAWTVVGSIPWHSPGLLRHWNNPTFPQQISLCCCGRPTIWQVIVSKEIGFFNSFKMTTITSWM